MKRTPINKVSKRRATEGRTYSKKRVIYLQKNPNCIIRSEVCTGLSTVIHHGRGRVGKNFLNEDDWFASCWKCNQYLEDHKAWGTAMGFRLDRIGI